MRLSRKTLLALEAVVDVAVNARPDPVQSRDITQRQGIPQRYLEQVLQRLVRANILKGVRGPRGGYSLARERRKISVADIVQVVEAMDAEGERDTGPASPLAQTVIHNQAGKVIGNIEAEREPGASDPFGVYVGTLPDRGRD